MYRVHDETIGPQNVVTLANEPERFAARIAPAFGGACVGLRHGDDELLHGACAFDGGPMGGRIPVLFPVVGRSFHLGELGRYRHRGAVYPMDIHGFVKDMPWREVGRRSDSCAGVTCEVESDERTRRSYPYDFRLSIDYAVRDRSLCMTVTVRNMSDDSMPFCFGYHPYFRAPIRDGRRGDCVVRIPGRAVWEMAEGQPTGRRLDAPPELAAGMNLPPDHLERILTEIEHGGPSCCELECPDAGKTIRVEFDEQALETVTVYAPPDSGYVCLEPRCGLPNALSDDAPVREGVKDLPPGEEFRTSVCIRVLAS